MPQITDSWSLQTLNFSQLSGSGSCLPREISTVQAVSAGAQYVPWSCSRLSHKSADSGLSHHFTVILATVLQL